MATKRQTRQTQKASELRRSREQEESDEGRKFAGYLTLWIEHDGEREAVDWLARHVGRLAAKAKTLERRVAALERSVAKTKGART